LLGQTVCGSNLLHISERYQQWLGSEGAGEKAEHGQEKQAGALST